MRKGARKYPGIPIAALMGLGLSILVVTAGLASDIVTIEAGEGAISHQLSRADLEEIDVTEVITHTPWDDGAVTYSGPLLRTLLQALSIDSEAIVVTALNHYASSIPAEDYQNHDVILAVRRNGQFMPIAEMGPAFIVYPFDSDPQLQARQYFSRAVWQVVHIGVHNGSN